jgi:serine/threonine protein phosphatase PrpC
VRKPDKSPAQTPPTWRVLHASARGTSHAHRDIPCQDRSACHSDGDSLCAVVADGAGSASLAGQGADTACEYAITAFERGFSRLRLGSENDARGMLCAFLREIREGMVQKAEERGVPLGELATTLILAVATSEAVAVAHIGDGASVLCDQNNALTTLTVPRSGEYANETSFITDPHALDQIQFRHWKARPKAIALLSDGLQRLALSFPAASPFPRFFLPVFEFFHDASNDEAARAELADFLASPMVTRRTDDDVTLLVGLLDSWP